MNDKRVTFHDVPKSAFDEVSILISSDDDYKSRVTVNYSGTSSCGRLSLEINMDGNYIYGALLAEVGKVIEKEF